MPASGGSFSTASGAEPATPRKPTPNSQLPTPNSQWRTPEASTLPAPAPLASGSRG
jgi:hypothetical protein